MVKVVDGDIVRGTFIWGLWRGGFFIVQIDSGSVMCFNDLRASFLIPSMKLFTEPAT